MPFALNAAALGAGVYEHKQPFCFMSFNPVFVIATTLSSSDSAALSSGMIC
jgi:hypothetical protein